MFIDNCNRLLLDGATDSARCMGHCAYCTWRSTISCTPYTNCLHMMKE